MASYNHDTTLQKDAPIVSNIQRLAIVPIHGENVDQPFDKVSVLSNNSCNTRNLLLPAIMQIECEAEISLDMMPFNSTGLNECYVMPGQVEE